MPQYSSREKINFQNNKLINCIEESLSRKLKFFQLRNSLSFMEPASWLLRSHETAHWPSPWGSTMQSEPDTLSLYDSLFSSTSLFQKCLQLFQLKPVRILICHSWLKFVLFDFIKVITSFWSKPRRCRLAILNPE